MIQEVIIKQKKDNGTKEFSKNGKTWESHSVSIKDDKGRWIGGLLNDKEYADFMALPNDKKVSLVITENKSGDKTYLNFKFPKEEDMMVKDIRQLKLFYRWFMKDVATSDQKTAFGNFYNQHK